MSPINIFVTLTFEGFHRWASAPDSVKFLRDFHRHIFHVKAVKSVSHCERDTEFILFKRELQEHINLIYAGQRFEHSCETIAIGIMNEFHCETVEVSEDGENGAIVHASRRHSTEIVTGPSFVLKGLECEGPCYGTKTLFVPTDISSVQLSDLLRMPELSDLEKVYVGGCNRPVKTLTDISNLSEIVDSVLPRVNLTFDVEFHSDAYCGTDAVPFLEKMLRRAHGNGFENVITAPGAFSKLVSVISTCVNFSHYEKTISNETICWKRIGGDEAIYATWTRHPYFALDQEIVFPAYTKVFSATTK
jgi:hypothetical protein